jgi:hypothetical protein
MRRFASAINHTLSGEMIDFLSRESETFDAEPRRVQDGNPMHAILALGPRSGVEYIRRMNNEIISLAEKYDRL